MAVGHVGEQVVEVHLERPHLVVVPLVADGEHEHVVAGLQLPLPALKEGLGSSRAHLAVRLTVPRFILLSRDYRPLCRGCIVVDAQKPTTDSCVGDGVRLDCGLDMV